MDGELTGVEMLEIRRHLDDCGCCLAQYEEVREAKLLLSRLPYAQPRPGLAEAICASLDCVRVPRHQKILNKFAEFGRARFTPVAAGFVGLGAVLMILIAQPTNLPDANIAHLPGQSDFASNIGLEEASVPFPAVSAVNTEPERGGFYIPADSGESSSGPVLSFSSYGGP
jgi:hypothetical protein